jgi:hypothetical protein
VQNVSSVGLRKKIYYKDWSTGPIVTFSHGWPLMPMHGAQPAHVSSVGMSLLV